MHAMGYISCPIGYIPCRGNRRHLACAPVIPREGEGELPGDRDLVELVRSGDLPAFEKLYRAHAPAVYRVARRRLADPEGASDVVQETFARALASLERLREPERFRPWILSIARNAATDVARSSSRLSPFLEDSALSVASDERGPEQLAELAELVSLMNVSVADLFPRDARALYLVTQLGMSPPEVAKSLGITTGAAKVTIHRARQRLRDALALRLMVRRRDLACAIFGELYDAGHLVRAARHLRVCETCEEAVVGQVHLYDAGRFLVRQQDLAAREKGLAAPEQV